MKNLVLIFLCLVSLNVQSKNLISGFDYSQKPVYFDDTSITSYGKLVTVKSKNFNKNPDSKESFTNERTFVYFCSFDDLETSSYQSVYFDESGKYKNSIEGDFSTSTSPISLEGNSNLDSTFGLTGIRNKLKSKCSQVSKKLPRLEIPIARGQNYIDHLILDTLKSQGNIKSVWVKVRNITGEVMKNDDGSPILIEGKEFKNYTFSQDKSYQMHEMYLDCQNSKFMISTLINYGPDGNIIKNYSNPYEVKKMEGVIPNSMGEEIHKFVCGF